MYSYFKRSWFQHLLTIFNICKINSYIVFRIAVNEGLKYVIQSAVGNIFRWIIHDLMLTVQGV